MNVSLACYTHKYLALMAVPFTGAKLNEKIQGKKIERKNTGKKRKRKESSLKPFQNTLGARAISVKVFNSHLPRFSNRAAKASEVKRIGRRA